MVNSGLVLLNVRLSAGRFSSTLKIGIDNKTEEEDCQDTQHDSCHCTNDSRTVELCEVAFTCHQSTHDQLYVSSNNPAF